MIIEELHPRGCNINAGFDNDVGSVLTHAVWAENIDAIKYLLNKKAKIRPQRQNMSTELYSAVSI